MASLRKSELMVNAISVNAQKLYYIKLTFAL